MERRGQRCSRAAARRVRAPSAVVPPLRKPIPASPLLALAVAAHAHAVAVVAPTRAAVRALHRLDPLRVVRLELQPPYPRRPLLVSVRHSVQRQPRSPCDLSVLILQQIDEVDDHLRAPEERRARRGNEEKAEERPGGLQNEFVVVFLR